MKCCKCQAEIKQDAKFCQQCGVSQADIDTLRAQCLSDVGACEKAIKAGQGSRAYIRTKFDERLSVWKQAAELGVREAQWLLGRCFDEGFGVERSDIHALSWHLKAAEQGYPIAQNYIGSCYQNGEGVPQDQAEAVQWYLKAAQQGYATAQANLGWCYDTGSGTAQDETEAVNWYRKAAEQGDSVSQFNLGVHYEWGSGLEQDKNQALNWYKKAAQQGYEKASEEQQRLADELAEQDQDQAEQLKETQQRFRRACRQAMADGEIEIGEKSHLRALAETIELSKEDRNRIFAEEKNIFKQKKRETETKNASMKFRIACKRALADGVLEVDEKGRLRQLADSLNISKEDAKRLFTEERKVFKASQQVQPTKEVELQFRKACKRVLADGKVTPQEESELINLARLLRMPNEVMKQIFTDEVAIYQKNQKTAPGQNAELQFRKACNQVLASGKITEQQENQLKSLAVFLRIPPQKMKEIFAEQARIYKQGQADVTTTAP
ncbi:MAG: hypothetical protein ACYSWP_01000 [Planctomycetota bacterium]|jgi:tellurite resistance protein